MKRILLPLLLTFLFIQPAHAEDKVEPKDFIFKGMADFKIASQSRTFDKLEIQSKNPESGEMTNSTYEGALISTTYAFKGDTNAFPSDLQMIRHYLNSVKKLEGTILHEEDRKLYASFTRNGKQYYMFVNPYGWNIDVKILEIAELEDDSELVDTPFKAGQKNHFMFKGMPNFEIATQSGQFDKLEILSQEPESDNVAKTTYEGNIVATTYAYRGPEGQFPSNLQMIRHYKNSLKKAEGTILHEEERKLYGSFTRDGKQYYIFANPYGWNIDVKILELAELADDSEIVDSDTILYKLDKEGFITLYINFDTGKATIKPESMEIIDEIVTALKSKPALKVKLEGHTDNVGNADANKKLSDDRANAVMNAIVAKGIDKGRLSAEGFGLDKPIADNNTEAGRAKNRRVALVKVQ